MSTTTAQLADQLDLHWRHQLRPRLDCLSDDALATPIGPAEGHWADRPMADLILHINREVIHHGAEIALLRDLYRSTNTKEN